MKVPPDAPWLDLLNPGDEERAGVEELLGVPLPRRQDISSLGLSSRHHDNDHVLSLHAQLYGDADGHEATPLGVLVSHERLVTLRFAPSKPVDKAGAEVRNSHEPLAGPDALVMLFECIVNDVAEQMQRIAGDMVHLSDDVFVAKRDRSSALRGKLVRVGRLEARLARFRSSLLGIGRIVGFVEHRSPDWFSEAPIMCIKVIGNDLKTLDEFDDQLTGKLQFLQDAVLGFINTDQNAVMKLLTVASVVAIPPVILAGVWGMNFKHMPALDKAWGYPMALGALLLSFLLPLLWFAARGWLSRD